MDKIKMWRNKNAVKSYSVLQGDYARLVAFLLFANLPSGHVDLFTTVPARNQLIEQ